MDIKSKIEKNKNIIVAVLILIAIVAAIFIVKNTVMFDETKAVYGNRTDGAKKVKVTEDQVKKIQNALKDKAKSVKVNQEGRTINIIIDTKPEVDLATAKEMANTALGEFTDAQKSYFDIEALIKNDSNKDQFPIIGYKHKTKGTYSWTRDRAKSEG